MLDLNVCCECWWQWYICIYISLCNNVIMPAQPSVHPGIVNVQDQAQPGTVSAQKTASIAATAPLLTVKVTNLFNYTI